MTEPTDEVEQHVHATIDSLAEEFAGVHTHETIHRLVHDTYERFRGAHDTEFVPLLTHRFARERLRMAEKANGGRGHGTPEVVFVCVQNAGRSQMSEAWMRELAGERIHVTSAGSAPATAVHDNVVEVMREVGLDLDTAYPKPLTDEAIDAADVVVTMGCGDACPVVPNTRYLDWDLPDPHGAGLDAVRETRDVIKARVQALIDELLAD